MSEEKKIIPEGQLTDEALDAATGGGGATGGYTITNVEYACPNPKCGALVPETLLVTMRSQCPFCRTPIDRSTALKTVRTISFKPHGGPQS